MSDSEISITSSPLSQEIMLSDDDQHVTEREGSSANEKNELQHLGVGLVDQTVLEREIMAKADKAIAERDEALDQKRLDKTRKEIR
ncbi:uncharacterized protein BYT42DRAFT_232976 [Radiomyces spectabilis]|uniref:uncharacterized protein n=1 Tax=Radiomyces spectabilis TaxID=64574 RepID=UPI00221EA09F|nr:uncharacterized protein BYT42DRAFT_232976 [Radiomyces spectabilis]KAI8388379.1 hypothetical protein BYT42DRAFT_232976 [Radiomyces spectabilis]